MSGWIEYQISAGTPLHLVCEDAVALADRIGVAIRFRFNGVSVFARPGDKPKEIALKWESDAKEEGI